MTSESETTTAEKPCVICGGTKAEHEGRAHVYTLNPGELITPQQQKQAEAKQFRDPAMPMGQPIPLGRMPAQAIPYFSGHPATDRLINLLVDKGVLNAGEALHVVLGRPLP